MTFPGQQQQFYPGQPQFPQQGYGQPQQYAQHTTPQQPAAAPAVSGSLDDFFSQPSVGGGPALKFEAGTFHVGIVARAITNADIQQQTIPGTSTPATYRDGRPKWVMKVPLVVQPSAVHPEGQAQWYVSGSARDELVRAMAEAGAPTGPPENGAAIRIECTGTRPAGAGMNPAKVYKVAYRRPDAAAAPVAEPVVASAPVAAPAPTPAVQATPPAAPQPPTDMSPDQQELLKSLGG